MNPKACFVALLAALTASTVFADGQSAANNFYANLGRAGKALDIKISETNVAPTLVRGMYRLETAQGKFIGITNEAGTLLGGGSTGFTTLPEFRRLTAAEMAELRHEVIANIDKNRLIKVRYGNGQAPVILFSAIDCPYCQKDEERLRNGGSQYNATFYIIPLSLRSLNEEGGRQQWQKVANIWCTSNSGNAWKKYWASGTVPAASQCPFSTLETAQSAYSDLFSIAGGLGISSGAIPTYIREDGVKVNLSTDMSAPTSPQSNSKWLAGGVSAKNFRSQRVIVSQASVSDTAQQEGQAESGAKTININLGDVLQGIFGGLTK